MRALYLTHPEVVIDPETPVPDWKLSDHGRARIAGLASAKGLRGVSQIISSAERKAVETATLLSMPLGLSPVVIAETGENDRSATGYLPQSEFDTAANAFFAHPDTSYRGWETARDAQKRILSAVTTCLSTHISGDILFVGHGAVGTLLFCALSNLPIARQYDQGDGTGGNYFSISLSTMHPVHGWRPLEDLAC